VRDILIRILNVHCRTYRGVGQNRRQLRARQDEDLRERLGQQGAVVHGCFNVKGHLREVVVRAGELLRSLRICTDSEISVAAYIHHFGQRPMSKDRLSLAEQLLLQGAAEVVEH